MIHRAATVRDRTRAHANKATDVQVEAAELYFLPARMRIPLKFGAETTTSVTCARARVTVRNRRGEVAEGWGETPLNVQWVWPSRLPESVRNEALKQFCARLGQAWVECGFVGHALEIGAAFIDGPLAEVHRQFDPQASLSEPLPTLAALACCSPFDLALHDAYGRAAGAPTYSTYDARFLNQDLSQLLEPAAEAGVDFCGKYPVDYFRQSPPSRLPAWHLVGGLDPLSREEARRGDPGDGAPYLLEDWIRQDQLKCLKVKLRGDDAAWDLDRLVRVGRIAAAHSVEALTADFNCMAPDVAYVNGILDRLSERHREIYDRILYVEQPFSYDMAANPIDVHGLSNRKPLLMDESASNWKCVRLGRSLGWNGVALKVCKTQTGAILSLCWAKAHGMHLMVQDLSNLMLAQIPHVLLAAHADTLMGVESNGMQFYPEASAPEATVHPGLYRRRGGMLELSTLDGPGFGYRIDEIPRVLPEPAARFGSS